AEHQGSRLEPELEAICGMRETQPGSRRHDQPRGYNKPGHNDWTEAWPQYHLGLVLLTLRDLSVPRTSDKTTNLPWPLEWAGPGLNPCREVRDLWLDRYRPDPATIAVWSSVW